MGAEDQSALEQQVAALTRRVWQLEETMRQMRDPSSAKTVAPASTVEVTHSVWSEGTVSKPPEHLESSRRDDAQVFLDSPPQPDDARASLESRIGSQFFNRIGILALLIGMAWFLKLAIDNHWIGELGRIIIGLVAGTGLILWSETFRRKGYPAFSYSLKAVGSGVLYLSLWAAFSVYHLIPAGIAFVAMILVTAWNGFMAWVQDAELLALYAIVGGFSTPLLLSTGENHELALFGYVLVLDVAVLVLIALRPWSRLLLGAFAGTLFFSIGWYFSYYNDSEFALTSGFAAAFFAIFAVAPRLMRPRTEAIDDARTSVVLVLLPLANAAIGFFEFYFILDTTQRRWAQPWTAVAFAAFYLLMLQFPSAKLPKPQQALLASLHLTFAVVFLTIAIPLEAHGRWITIGWLVEGVALLWAAKRLRLLLLRVLASGSLVLGFFSLMATNLDSPGPVIFNARFATYLAAIAAFAIAAYIAASTEPEDSSNSQDRLTWTTVAASSVLAMNLLLLVAGMQEIHTYWFGHSAGYIYPFYSPEYTARRIDEQFTQSAWAMLFGALLLTVGFTRRSAFLRWQALVVIALTIAKVFLSDMSNLSQGYRVLSFLGLGALLLGVSFVYQRDLLHLKKQKLEQPQ